MPRYNILPSGFAYSFIVNAENEEKAFKKMEFILKEAGISEEELELYLFDAMIELKPEGDKETNL